MKRLRLIAAGLLAAAACTAQSLAPDQFAVELAAEVAAFKALADFSAPASLTPAPAVEPAAAVPPAAEAPYSLPELLAMGAGCNASLKAAVGAKTAAQARLTAAKARRLPTFSTDTSSTMIGNPLEPVSLTAGELGSYQGVLIPPVDVVLYEGMESTYYQFKVTAEVPVYTWGKINLGIDLANAGVQAAEIQREKAAHELAVKIRGVFESLGYVSGVCRVLEMQSRVGRRLVEIAEASSSAGFMTTADLLGVRIRLKETDLAMARAEEQRDKLLSSLASMVGLEGLSLDQLDLETPATGQPRWTRDRAYALIATGSYDLALVSALVESKRKAHALAKADARGLPDIGLRLEASYGGFRFPFIEKDWYGQDDWALNLSLGTTGAALGSAVKAGDAAKAEAEIEEALAKKEDAERSVRGFVRETYLTADLDQAKIEYAALKQDAWAADLAQKQVVLKAGAGSENEFLTVMMEALGGLAEAYGTMAEYRSAILSLEGAAGSMATE